MLVIAPLLALGALYRERDAQARARRSCSFALERSTLEKQALDARLTLLQAQIEPHFLFNTLANVQALVEIGLAAGRAGAEEPDRLPARGDAAPARRSARRWATRSRWCAPTSS